MKIRCEKCNKRFDLDVCSGVCPKCGYYNRIVPNQVDQTIHTKKNRSKRYHIATAVLVIAIVVSWAAAREIATQLNEK